MGVLDRLILRDDQWQRISQHIIGDERTCGSSGRDNRMFVEAVLWIVRTGSPWRDLAAVAVPYGWCCASSSWKPPVFAGDSGAFKALGIRRRIEGVRRPVACCKRDQAFAAPHQSASG